MTMRATEYLSIISPTLTNRDKSFSSVVPFCLRTKESMRTGPEKMARPVELTDGSIAANLVVNLAVAFDRENELVD